MRGSTMIILGVIAVVVLAGGAAAYWVYSMFTNLDCKAEALSGKGINSSIEIKASTNCNQANGGHWLWTNAAETPNALG